MLITLLSSRPLPPPIAGSPAATPISAPAAAPIVVPTAALAGPLSLTACCGVPLPIRSEAYCWQVASSFAAVPKSLVKPANEDLLTSRPVSKALNNVKNNGPKLLA